MAKEAVDHPPHYGGGAVISLLTIALAACTGAVSPGVPLLDTAEASATACPFVEGAELTIELSRDSGECDEVIPLELTMRTARHGAVDGCIGYVTTLETGCGATVDLTCQDVGRVLGWVESGPDGLFGALHVSRGVAFAVGLQACFGEYGAAETVRD